MSIRHAMLGLLQDGPKHPYQMASELEHWIGGGAYNTGQIYQGVKWLIDRGLITEEPLGAGAARYRRPVQVTLAGRREFARWLRSPLLLPRQPRDDVLAKMIFLGRDHPEALVRSLQQLRRIHLKRVARAKARIRPASGDHRKGTSEELLIELTGKAFVFRENADLEWIDHCLERLRAASQSSAVADEAPAGAASPSSVGVEPRGCRTTSGA
jgi:DNA-binding PadR family transcriptional regulator